MKIKMSTASNFVKANDDFKGKVLEIKSEGEFVDSDKFTYQGTDTPVKNLIFDVTVDGVDYQYRMNASSRRQMFEAFGDDTKDWIGKKAKIMVLPTPKGDTKMIILDPFKEASGPALDKIASDGWGE